MLTIRITIWRIMMSNKAEEILKRILIEVPWFQISESNFLYIFPNKIIVLRVICQLLRNM